MISQITSEDMKSENTYYGNVIVLNKMCSADMYEVVCILHNYWPSYETNKISERNQDIHSHGHGHGHGVLISETRKPSQRYSETRKSS